MLRTSGGVTGTVAVAEAQGDELLPLENSVADFVGGSEYVCLWPAVVCCNRIGYSLLGEAQQRPKLRCAQYLFLPEVYGGRFRHVIEISVTN
jgi:hypothetical protein